MEDVGTRIGGIYIPDQKAKHPGSYEPGCF